MSKLGELFKTEREKRNLSLHEIGMSLKINPKILKAIEDNDTPNLPAKTFLRGFVKSYAQYFRFDVNEIMQQFQDEYGTTRPEAPQPPTSLSSQSTSASTPSVKTTKSLKKAADSALPASTTNKIFPIVGAIILLIMIAFVAKMMDKYQKESQISKVDVVGTELSTTTSTTLPGDVANSGPLTEGPNASALATDGGTTSTTLPTTDGTTPGAAPMSTSGNMSSPVTPTTILPTTTTLKPVSTTTTSTTLKAVAATTTTTTLKPVPVTTTTLKPVPVTTTTMKPVATTTTTLKMPVALPVAVTTTTLKASQATEVIVEALNRVNVRFSLNGQKWETLELSPDQVHTLRSKTNIQIELSDGGAVNIIVNGHDRGVPGTIGRPMKLSYP